MKLSVVILSLDGKPRANRAFLDHPDVEVIDVVGVRPVGRARNEGLKRAQGDYIAWIDGDDDVSEDYLPSIFGALDGNPDAVIFGQEWRMDGTFGFPQVWSGGDFVQAVLRGTGLYSGFCNKIFRRELWDGIRFDDEATTAEDWEVLPALAVRSKKTVNLQRVIYYYIHTPGSLTTAANLSLKREGQRKHFARIEEAKKLGLWDRYRKDIIAGVANQVYHTAEFLSLYMDVSDPAAHALVKEARGFIFRNLPTLLFSHERRALKLKWILAALGWWKTVKLYYRLRYGQAGDRAFVGFRRDAVPAQVHVVLASDENYRPALDVAKSGIIASCSDPSRLVFHEFGADAMDKIDTSALRPWNGSYMAYLRLFLSDLLPEVDSVVYSDVDTIWERDILELAAKADSRVSVQWVRDFGSVARFPGYGCSGVCILNLKRLRELGFVRMARRRIAEKGLGEFPDQDLLNDLLKSESFLLPPCWNTMGDFSNLPRGGEKCVYHLTGLGRHLRTPEIAWPPQYALWHFVQSGGKARLASKWRLRYRILAALWPLRVFAIWLTCGKLRERIVRNWYFAKVLIDRIKKGK